MTEKEILAITVAQIKDEGNRSTPRWVNKAIVVVFFFSLGLYQCAPELVTT